MEKTLTYKDAGVNIDAGNALVNKIKKHVAKTIRPGVIGQLGGFAGFFELPTYYRQPILVSCTDGVGTKLRLAIDHNQNETIGIDCVAMCVNDCIVSGAKPLWFLDYFATGHLDVQQAEIIIASVAQGCLEAEISLLGGETAEMPDMYQAGDYDLAGFCVGVVEKSELIYGDAIQPGFQLIALPSSGFHSNGYSLIRKILSTQNIDVYQNFEETSLLEKLLTPTKIYVKPTLLLANEKLSKGAAHITGGGLLENVPRFLPPHCKVVLDSASWDIPPLFLWLQTQGNLSAHEMIRTFNCGVGMVYCVAPEHTKITLEILESLGEKPWHIGRVEEKKDVVIEITGLV